jgi:hypothetical protein
MAVRLALLLTGNPRKRETSALDAPSASSSEFALIRSPRSAKARPVSTTSLKAITSTLAAGPIRSRTSRTLRLGTCNGGRPHPGGDQAAVISAVDDSGPIDNDREEPRMA